METVALVFAAVLGLSRAPYADPVQDWQRLESFAEDVALAPVAVPEHPFKGEAGDLAAALAIVAIGKHESNFEQAVIDCRKTGDRTKGQAIDAGPSVTAFQLKGAFGRGRFTRAEICASNRLAAEQSLRVLSGHASRCSRSAPLAWFQGYANGNCGHPAWLRIPRKGKPDDLIDAGLVRCKTWERLARSAGLEGASCDKAGPIRYASRQAPVGPDVSAWDTSHYSAPATPPASTSRTTRVPSASRSLTSYSSQPRSL